MTALKKVLESSMKIRFHDCDPFSHLNNSRYIDYIITARGDQLIENYGFDIYKLATEKALGWVTAQTQISYLSPAKLMEKVFIQTRLIDCTEKSLLLEAFMWDDSKTNLKAVMWMKLVHYNLKTQRSCLHDEGLMQLFNQIVYPLETTVSFEERIQGLKQIQ
ncbi:MAG: acyl-CoA thioesterase [Ferruginibacter sp.]